MKPLDQLRSILGRTYNYCDEMVSITLSPGMSDPEISEFRKKLPNQFLPADIEELLRFTRGFHLNEYEYVHFDSVYSDEWFPHCIYLAHSTGQPDNWVIDIDSDGNWGPVYYVNDELDTIVKHTATLSAFIQFWDAWNLDPDANDIYGVSYQIYHSKERGLRKKSIKSYGAPKEFVQQLPMLYRIADLQDAPLLSGFTKWKYGKETRGWRLGDQPVWVIEKHAWWKIKKGSRL